MTYLRVMIIALIVALPVLSRNTKQQFSVSSAKSKHANVLRKDVQLYWHGEDHPNVQESKAVVQVSKKTNAFGKSDLEACDWVLHSALKALQAHAVKMGGNAVINICTVNNREKYCDESKYECLAGTTVAKVALTGEVVVLGEGTPSKKSKHVPDVVPEQVEEN